MSNELTKLPGIKEAELARCGPCPICREPLISPGHGPTFYVLTMRRAGLLTDALARRAGLQAMLGGVGALAQAMGPDEDLAKVVDGPHEVVVHEDCAGRVDHLLNLVPEGKK